MAVRAKKMGRTTANLFGKNAKAYTNAAVSKSNVFRIPGQSGTFRLFVAFCGDSP
jgi:hypothetical protein